MYTDEEEAFLKENYPQMSVEELAAKLNRSTRSIIGKLSRLGIYVKKEYRNKRGERPVTKLELCARIAQALELEPEQLEGLSKAPKSVLREIILRLERAETLDEI